MSLPIINNLTSYTKNGQIGDGVYIAYEWIGNPRDANLCRGYIGTRQGGPILQYVRDGYGLWDGHERRNYPDGAWTPLYSYGNHGRRYAYGGNWTGHHLSLHPCLSAAYGYKHRDEHIGNMTRIGQEMVIVPDGIAGEVSVTSLDCSGGWTIWYSAAILALENRLTHDQIVGATLPKKAKTHIIAQETGSLIVNVMETIEAYHL